MVSYFNTPPGPYSDCHVVARPLICCHMGEEGELVRALHPNGWGGPGQGRGLGRAERGWAFPPEPELLHSRPFDASLTGPATPSLARSGPE